MQYVARFLEVSDIPRVRQTCKKWNINLYESVEHAEISITSDVPNLVKHCVNLSSLHILYKADLMPHQYIIQQLPIVKLTVSCMTKLRRICLPKLEHLHIREISHIQNIECPSLKSVEFDRISDEDLHLVKGLLLSGPTEAPPDSNLKFKYISIIPTSTTLEAIKKMPLTSLKIRNDHCKLIAGDQIPSNLQSLIIYYQDNIINDLPISLTCLHILGLRFNPDVTLPVLRLQKLKTLVLAKVSINRDVFDLPNLEEVTLFRVKMIGRTKPIKIKKLTIENTNMKLTNVDVQFLNIIHPRKRIIGEHGELIPKMVTKLTINALNDLAYDTVLENLTYLSLNLFKRVNIEKISKAPLQVLKLIGCQLGNDDLRQLRAPLLNYLNVDCNYITSEIWPFINTLNLRRFECDTMNMQKK